jgi:hypothetical protein
MQWLLWIEHRDRQIEHHLVEIASAELSTRLVFLGARSRSFAVEDRAKITRLMLVLRLGPIELVINDGVVIANDAGRRQCA